LIRAVIFNIFNELTKKIADSNKSFAAANIKSFLLLLNNILDFILLFFWMVNL